jgi:sigma-B regulation protein RsbQ
MWRYIAAGFEATHKVITFDLTGSGRSDRTAYDKLKYGTLQGYADDLVEICDALDVKQALVAAHSVGCMIAMLASIKRPDLFERLMLLGPSPCYLNLPGYEGGFDRAGIDELLGFLEINLEGWATQLAPMVMANADRPELTAELESYFVRNDPDIAHHFANVVFLGDHRADLPKVTVPTLIMQCRDDIIAPMNIGDFMHAAMPQSELVILDTQGHYPHLSAPDTVAAALHRYLDAHIALAA